MTGFEAFKKSAVEEVIRYFDNLDESAFDTAVALITTAESNHGRLHITGIGKPGHVAAYGASLFSSTGTPMYFLHGTEAVHGSCGQLMENDIVISISNSGKTMGIALLGDF